MKRRNKDGKTEFMPLELLPTPISTDIRHKRRTMELKEAGAETMGSRRNGESRPNGLTDWLDFHGMLPTPTARDYQPSCSPNAMTRKDGKPRTDMLSNLPAMTGNHSRQTGGVTFQLNPLFVAEMMGFPREWLTLPFLGRNGARNP